MQTDETKRSIVCEAHRLLRSKGRSIVSRMQTDETKRSIVCEAHRLLRSKGRSIVSRVLLKNKGGTVTLFAFDEGEGLSEHTAPFDALVVVLDGSAVIEIASESFAVGKGETITLPAHFSY